MDNIAAADTLNVDVAVVQQPEDSTPFFLVVGRRRRWWLFNSSSFHTHSIVKVRRTVQLDLKIWYKRS